MKKLISILLVVVMCFGLVGCGITETIQISEKSVAKLYSELKVPESSLVKFEKFIEDNKGKPISLDENDSEETLVLDDETIEYLQEYVAAIRSFKNIGTEQEPIYASYSVDTVDIKKLKDLYDETCHIEISQNEFMIYSFDSVKDELEWFFYTMGGIDEDTAKVLSAFDMEIDYSILIKMPHKIVKTNADLVDDYTAEISSVLDGNFLYIVTENSTCAWAAAEDVKSAVVEEVKNAIVGYKTYKPRVYFKDTTTATIEFRYDKFSKYTVEYKEKGGEWKKAKDVILKRNNRTTIKNLSPDKKYYFRATGFFELEDLGRVYGITSKPRKLNFRLIKTPKFTLTSGKKSFKINMKKDYKGIWYYQVKYSKNEDMKKAKNFKFSSQIKTIDKLKDGTTYYVQIRKAFKFNTFSEWTKVKKVTTK